MATRIRPRRLTARRRQLKLGERGGGEPKHDECAGEVDAPGTSAPKANAQEAVKDAGEKARAAAQGGCDGKACRPTGTCWYTETRLEVISTDPAPAPNQNKVIAKVRSYGKCQCEVS